MRILIVGGGVAGLTLAALLEGRGLDVVLIEEQPVWSHQGYGIALWPMGSRILKGIGLFRQFLDLAVPIERYRVVDRRERLISSWNLRALFGPRDQLYMITRPDLIGLLAGSLRGVDLRMGTTATDISQTSERAAVTFSTGVRETFDLVVGCDGIHSRTRQQIVGAVSLRSTGWGGWAWWVDPSLSRQRVITEYWTPGRFLGLYPARDQLFCFLGIPNSEIGPDRDHPRMEVIHKELRCLGNAADDILAATVRDQQPFYWDFSDLSMARWHQGRVLLIGDACDAILPTAGIGASSAMESAAVLADELLRAGADDIPRVCELYTARRRRRVHAFQASSRRMAAIMFLKSRVLCAGRDLVLRALPAAIELRAFAGLLRRPM